jgi:hypothetical protein
MATVLDVEAAMNGWISVKDRLPTQSRDVLIVARWRCSGPEVCVAYFDTKHELFLQDGFWMEGDDDVTHWMPLPEPPK